MSSSSCCVALFEGALTQQGYVAGQLWLHSTATYTAGNNALCQGCFNNCNVVLKARHVHSERSCSASSTLGAVATSQALVLSAVIQSNFTDRQQVPRQRCTAAAYLAHGCFSELGRCSSQHRTTLFASYGWVCGASVNHPKMAPAKPSGSVHNGLLQPGLQKQSQQWQMQSYMSPNTVF